MTETSLPTDPSAANLAHWEDLAVVHGGEADRYYDLAALIAGEDLMGSHEKSALDEATGGTDLSGVSGLDVLHIQSHIGCDSISMARRGARVTSVDFSPRALARCRALAKASGVEVETVEADARFLPESLDAGFDVAYASIGALCWIDDLDSWMSSAARALRPGGTLVLVELHPLLSMLATCEPLVFDFPYNNDGPRAFSGTGSYADPDADVSWTVVEYAHGVAEVVTSAARAGLSLRLLAEHTESSFDPRGDLLQKESDGMYRLRVGEGASGKPAEPLPVLFTLLASKS